jgi:hypothetical protein
MSEATLQADVQRELLRMTSTFSSGDVVISDWSVLDGSSQNAPFVIIEVADGFNIDGLQTRQWENIINIPITLFVRFIDWDTSMLAFRDARQSVLDGLAATSHYQSASAKLAWGLLGISSDGGINSVEDHYVENQSESLPIYLSQRFILEVKEVYGD